MDPPEPIHGVIGVDRKLGLRITAKILPLMSCWEETLPALEISEKFSSLHLTQIFCFSFPLKMLRLKVSVFSVNVMYFSLFRYKSVFFNTSPINYYKSTDRLGLNSLLIKYQPVITKLKKKICIFD